MSKHHEFQVDTGLSTVGSNKEGCSCTQYLRLPANEKSDKHEINFPDCCWTPSGLFVRQRRRGP